MAYSREYDYLVIGAGPAGLQLGHDLQQARRDYLILEAGESAGTLYDTLPRHDKLLSINKIYTGYTERETQLRYDWNSLLCDDPTIAFKNFSKRYFPIAAEMKQYLVAFANHFALNIHYRTRVCRISKDDVFTVTDQQGNTYTGKRLIIATGVGVKPYIPPIPGIELGEHYFDFPCDPEAYSDQRVLIIGKGNSAFETANSMVETARVIHLCSPSSVKLAWESHFMGHLRATNNDFLDTYHLKGQNSVLDAIIEKLERRSEGIVAHVRFPGARGQRMELAYDRVLICAGFMFDSSLFDQTCQPELTINGRFPAMTSEWESTNITDLYFAGTLTQVRDFKKTMSNVIHGFRFNTRFLAHIFGWKYHQQPLPRQTFPTSPIALVDCILQRVSTTCALFLQPGFLCDALVIDEQGGMSSYYKDIPVDYVHDGDIGCHHHYYLITLEYGHIEGNPLSVKRDPDPKMAHKDVYLHPVIRRFNASRLVCEHHIPENLENNWQLQHRSQQAVFLSTSVPEQFSSQEMLDYDQQLLEFFLAQLAV